MPKCPYCGEPLRTWKIGGNVSIDCNAMGCTGNISTDYTTAEEAIAAASKRYADTARLTKVTKQAVEAFQGAELDYTGAQTVKLIDQIEKILHAATVTDERDAVELTILMMAAIAEAFYLGGVS